MHAPNPKQLWAVINALRNYNNNDVFLLSAGGGIIVVAIIRFLLDNVHIGA